MNNVWPPAVLKSLVCMIKEALGMHIREYQYHICYQKHLFWMHVVLAMILVLSLSLSLSLEKSQNLLTRPIYHMPNTSEVRRIMLIRNLTVRS